jgi:hypothetical protein
MRDVSCRALQIFLGEAKKKGVSPESLCVGTGYNLDHLRTAKERIEWPAYVAFLKNCARIWSEEEFVALGGKVFRSPIIRPLSLVARLLFTPIGVYKWMNDEKGPGKQLFQCIDTKISIESSTSLSLSLAVAGGLELSREFFWVTKGSFIDLPRLFGLPPAEVQLSWTERGGVYRVALLDKKASWWNRAAKGLSVVSVAKELKAANEDLVEQYKTIQLQAQRLEVAQRISLVAQTNLDLDATL